MATKNKVEFNNSETKSNLARAFANETMEGARYQFTSQLAQTEGYEYLKNILKTIAKNEMAHAKTYFNLITSNCGGTKNNIEVCANYPFYGGSLLEQLKMHQEDEEKESQSIYLSFAKTAEKEGFLNIAKTFKLVAQVEEIHYNIISEIIQKLSKNKLYSAKTSTVWKCDDCGYEASCKNAWEVCPLCGSKQGFVQIDVQSKAI